MSHLDTDIIVHKVPLKEGSTLVKQKLWRTHPYMVLKVKDEIMSQWDDSFLEVVRYP